jgi:hypothetical protein
MRCASGRRALVDGKDVAPMFLQPDFIAMATDELYALLCKYCPPALLATEDTVATG